MYMYVREREGGEREGERVREKEKEGVKKKGGKRMREIEIKDKFSLESQICKELK